MTDFTPLQHEEIGRLWCSKENNNINLSSDNIVFWDDDEKLCLFEFDIASPPRRKENEKLLKKIKEHKEQHGKIESGPDYSSIVELSKLVGYSPGTLDKREIIGMVKSGSHTRNRHTFQAILGDCFLLTRAKADKKYMILTDKKMYDYTHDRCKAILSEIELVYLNPYEQRHLLKIN